MKNMDRYNHVCIEFEGILKLEPNLSMNYYINNIQKVLNKNVYDLLEFWKENKSSVNLIISSDDDTFDATGLISKHNYNGIDEVFIGNSNLEEWMFYHTDKYVKLKLRRA